MRLASCLACARLNARVLRLAGAGRWLTPDDVRASYDRLAPDYDRAWLRHLSETTRHLVGLLPSLPPGGSLVELGCGTGFATRLLLERFPGRPILACDLSEGMLAQARAASAPGARVTWTRADMLDFLRAVPAGDAALVFAAWSIGYVDTRRALRLGARALARGGTLAFVVNLADTLGPLRRAFRHCMQAYPHALRCLTRFPFPRHVEELARGLSAARLRLRCREEGTCPIVPPPSPDGRKLPWLLRTGTLAGFDRMLPLDRPGPVADLFEARLAADPDPIVHHYALMLAEKP